MFRGDTGREGVQSGPVIRSDTPAPGAGPPVSGPVSVPRVAELHPREPLVVAYRNSSPNTPQPDLLDSPSPAIFLRYGAFDRATPAAKYICLVSAAQLMIYARFKGCLGTVRLMSVFLFAGHSEEDGVGLR